MGRFTRGNAGGPGRPTRTTEVEYLVVKGEDTAMSQFDYAGPLSEIIVLGDIALMHPGRKLLWNSKNMRIANDEAANKSPFMRRLAPRDDMKWYRPSL